MNSLPPRRRGHFRVALAFLIFSAAAAGAEEPAEKSPWSHGLWRDSSPVMRAYACAHASRAPDWCQRKDDTEKVYEAPLDEVFGPHYSVDDARWLKMMQDPDPQGFTKNDVAFIVRRARDAQDPQAMEVLGFLYGRGLGVRRDPVEAYRWYGHALLRGATHVKENMDLLWSEIAVKFPRKAGELVVYFEQLKTTSELEPDPRSSLARQSGALAP